MYLKTIFGLLIISILGTEVYGKTFTKCSLAKELRKQGFQTSSLPDWVCLVNSESSFRTDVIGTQNADGSKDYGLFQINDRYWCNQPNEKGCNVRCDSLLTDDITVASKCAKKIFKIHKFSAWEGWKKQCQGKPLPDLSDCFSDL